MATLELAIDATKAQQGAQVAQQAFVQVQKAADGAARSVQVSSQAVSSAFQATGGTVQIAGGITATAKALGDLNAVAASSNVARLLLEIGKTAKDFKEVAAGVQNVTTSYDIYGTKITTVTQATGRFGTVLATLNGIIKANPLLAAATAISAIGTALSLFTSESKQAADAYRGFTEELAKTRISDEAAAILGIRGPGAAGRAGALTRAAEFTAAGGTVTTSQLPGYERQAAELLRQTGTPRQQVQAQQFLETGGTTRMGSSALGRTEFVPGLPDMALTRKQTETLLKQLYETNQKQLEADKASTSAAEDTARARRQIADQLQSQLVQFGAEPSLPGALGGFETRGYEAPYFVQRPTVAPGTYQFGAGPAVQTQMPQVGFPTGPYAGAEYQYQGGRLRPQYQVEPGQAPPLLQRPEQMTMTGGTGATMDMTQAFDNAVRSAAMIAEYKKQEAEAAEANAEAMRRAADYAANIGGSLGSAFADVLMKTTTLRQAFASILASFARQGLADAGAGLFKAVFNGVAGATPTQTAGNMGVQQTTA
jgi:hypothetical protein